MAASSSSGPSASDVIKMLGHASGTMSRDDLRDLDVGCEVTKEVLRRKVVDLVGRH